jgi:hypothetical protein
MRSARSDVRSGGGLEKGVHGVTQIIRHGNAPIAGAPRPGAATTYDLAHAFARPPVFELD